MLLYWIKKQNEGQSADISIDSQMEKDVFESRPIFNPHGINGIVIAQGARIGKKFAEFHIKSLLDAVWVDAQLSVTMFI